MQFKVVPTQKLYYGKFLYCLKFKIIDSPQSSWTSIGKDSTVKAIKKLVKDSGNPFRHRLDWNVVNSVWHITFGIYTNDSDMCDYLIKTYPTLVSFIGKPMNEKHKDLLLNKIEVIVREKLLYNNFRYKVLLKFDYRQQNKEFIKGWIQTQFEHKMPGRKGDYLLTGGHWLRALFLKEEQDLVMVQMCLSDYIYSVTRVELVSDTLT